MQFLDPGHKLEELDIVILGTESFNAKVVGKYNGTLARGEQQPSPVEALRSLLLVLCKKLGQVESSREESALEHEQLAINVTWQLRQFEIHALER